MQISRSTRVLAAGAVALAMIASTPAMAGEVTGNSGDTAGPAHANSICVFSGLNDSPSDIFGKIQSWGWTMRVLDLVARFFNPGDACRGGSNVPE